VQQAHALNWRALATAADLYRLDTLHGRLTHWPKPHRVLPTLLGNTLRAAEDALELDAGVNLESYVVRHLDDMPAALRREHDNYRGRLDLYCSLVVVFCLLIPAPLILWGISPTWVLATACGGAAGLAALAYRAAVASARGYGAALREIGCTVHAAKDA
jgi:hypothetical protein